MMDLSTTPINGVAPSQPIAQYPSPDSVQSTIKRKRVESSEDEAQVNGNAPQDVRDNVQSANIQEQVAELVAVLQRYARHGLLSSQASSRQKTNTILADQIQLHQSLTSRSEVAAHPKSQIQNAPRMKTASRSRRVLLQTDIPA